MKVLILLALGLAAVLADPSSFKRSGERFIGGSPTDISNYPYAAAFQYYHPMFPQYRCSGTIISSTTIVSIAHLFLTHPTNIPSQWRIRVGSTFTNREGYMYGVQAFIVHPDYDRVTFDSDISVIHTTSPIIFYPNVAAAPIAGLNYVVADNSEVQAIGWRSAYHNPLRHVDTRIVNQDTCRARYAELGRTVTDKMLCTGWLDVADETQCQGDVGGPILQNDVLVGIYTWDNQCELGIPSLNTKISSFTTWITDNA